MQDNEDDEPEGTPSGNDTTSSSTEDNKRPWNTIRSDLAATFDRDWNSMYALELIR